MAKTDKSIPYAKFPEQVGISSNEIKALIDDFKRSDIELHSLKILRYGKCAYEGYAFPYNAETPHTMYSVSKTFTSIAIGFLIDEGRLSLDTKVIDLFPDYRPEKEDPYLEKMTVFHLLTMSAGKSVSVIDDKSKHDWVRSFFRSKWGYEPGNGWEYISENTYMCCVILKRLTGMGVIDYLTPRLFEPLGITRRPQWETDHDGLEAGGWGLFITTDELSRVVLCLSQNGMYDGQQVIPEWYVKEATSKQVQNNRKDPNSNAGYGFFIWRNGYENSYRLDGMFSQFGIVFENDDACLICTCSEVDEEKTRCCIFRHFPQMFTDKCKKAPDGAIPAEELKIDPLPSLEAHKTSVMEEFIKGKKIRFIKNPILNVANFPTSMLPIAVVYMSAEKSGNIDNVILDFNESECIMSWDEGKDHNTIVCGMDGVERYSKIHLGGIDFTAVSTAAWTDNCDLEIHMRPLESISERIIKLVFKGDMVTLYPECCPPLWTVAKSLADGVEDFLPKQIAPIGAKVIGKVDAVLEIPLIGKIKM